jgi:hypothetical protein
MKKILALTNRVQLFTVFANSCTHNNLEHVVQTIFKPDSEELDPDLQAKIRGHNPDLVVIDGVYDPTAIADLLKLCEGLNVRIRKVKPRTYTPEEVAITIEDYQEVEEIYPRLTTNSLTVYA